MVLIPSFPLLETMRPADFLEIRTELKSASGFQSRRFREIEFISGAKNERYIHAKTELRCAERRMYVYAAVSCLYLFTLGIFVPAHRSLVSKICRHFGYGQEPVKLMIPVVGLSDIAPDWTPIQVREPTWVNGNVSVLELVVIAKLIRCRGPRALFEIGTFDGRTTLNMAANCFEEAHVFTLDLPADQVGRVRLPLARGDGVYIKKVESGTRFLGTDCERRIVQLYGDSAAFDFSPFFSAIDLVFIDGSHSYEYVLHDTNTAMKLLRNGKGVILWHDYGEWDGVTRALDELYLGKGSAWGLKHIEGTSLVCMIAD